MSGFLFDDGGCGYEEVSDIETLMSRRRTLGAPRKKAGRPKNSDNDAYVDFVAEGHDDFLLGLSDEVQRRGAVGSASLVSETLAR